MMHDWRVRFNRPTIVDEGLIVWDALKIRSPWIDRSTSVQRASGCSCEGDQWMGSPLRTAKALSEYDLKRGVPRARLVRTAFSGQILGRFWEGFAMNGGKGILRKANLKCTTTPPDNDLQRIAAASEDSAET
jgi:hypothetical protein